MKFLMMCIWRPQPAATENLIIQVVVGGHLEIDKSWHVNTNFNEILYGNTY